MGKGLLIYVSILLLFALPAKAGYARRDTSVAMDSVKIKKRALNQHYLSLNTTFFIKQLLSFTNGTVTVTASPYIFEYKWLHKGHGLRFGAGGSLSNKKQFFDSSQVTITRNNSFDFRLGYVYQRKIAKAWSFFAGFDVVGQTASSLNRINTNVDIVSNKVNGYTIGGGPSFGVQVNFGKRIGMFTESAIYYNFNHQKSGLTSYNFPDLNTDQKTFGNSLQFVIPTSLFFFVKF